MYGKFSTEQLIDRWEDQRDIKNLMGRYSEACLIKKEKTIFKDFWAAADDVCYGVNDGWYSGPEAVAGYYEAIHQGTLLKAELFKKHFCDKLADKTLDEIYGMGALNVKPMGTPIIEIAADGKTAKGIWYCQGAYSDVTPAGPVAYWTFGVFAVDFIREGAETDFGGGWKIWHMLYVEDINHPCGQNWTQPTKPYPDVPDFAELKAFELPAPNVAAKNHELYTPDRPFTKTPPIPEPYETFAETFSYGI